MTTAAPLPSRPTLAARVTAAVSFVLVPTGLLVVPALLPSPDVETARELFEQLRDHSAPYVGFTAQTVGVVAAVAAALAVVLLVWRAGRRGRVLATLGGVLAVTAAVGALLVLGMEFAQSRIVLDGPDPAAAVEDALVVNEWGVFLALLGVGLLGVFAALVLLTAGLARARLVPAWTPAVFVAPVAVSFVPAGVTEWLVLAAVLAACATVAFLLLRQGPHAPAAPAVLTAAPAHTSTPPSPDDGFTTLPEPRSRA